MCRRSRSRCSACSWARGGCRARAPGTLVASLGVGLVGVSIREFALAAPAAILVAAWARNRADERVWLTGVSVVLAVGAACVLVVAASVPGRGMALLTPDPWRLASLGPPSRRSPQWSCLPPRWAWATDRELRPEHVILGAALVVFMYLPPNGPLAGQLWMADGLVGNALLNGTRDPVIGSSAWALSEQLASFAAILLAALVLAWGQSRLAGSLLRRRWRYASSASLGAARRRSSCS